MMSFKLPSVIPTQLHRLLQRQIKRHLGDPDTLSEELKAFIYAVNDAYEQADDDRDRLERSLELSSRELLEANAQMRSLLQTVEHQVTERTAELTQANTDLATALKELQDTQTQLIQSEKMSSLGQMVAGVAHEINNPVSFIAGNIHHAQGYIEDLLYLIDLYQQEYPQPGVNLQEKIDAIDLDFLIEDLQKLLKSMRVGSDRIQKIVLSLRNFSRLDESDRKKVDLHEGIENTLLILQHRLKGTGKFPAVKIHREYGKLPPIHCYPSLLNQVFMNVLSNAIDALEDSPKLRKDPPQIKIRTAITEIDTVQISIADNGAGMTDYVRQKLFDPFFTTKPIGKGTGLGLSISYSIVVNKHNGQFTCHSTLGEGTEFAIEIPRQQYPKY
jgi:two-component system, NtrC family, sensor kinase